MSNVISFYEKQPTDLIHSLRVSRKRVDNNLQLLEKELLHGDHDELTKSKIRLNIFQCQRSLDDIDCHLQEYIK